ncbi:signal peptidase II [Allopusillimonas ginsengisoli]|uniref:signal peptidase II n=1 Tax=Allopusillimonas ginsengisoli TaxID=453575 RepID=UPI0039C100A1
MRPQFSSRIRRWLWYVLAFVLVALDQAIKQATVATLPLHTSVSITSWFNWVHVLNPGAAFSFLAQASDWQLYVFSVAGLVVSSILVFMLWRGVSSRLLTTAYVVIIGGAMGNVVDRLRIGAVVDYLDFHWQQWHWPTFNLADVLVVGGAILLIISAWAMPQALAKGAA